MAGYDKITTDGKKFFAELKKLATLQVRIGYQRGEKADDGADLVDVAAWNELGTSKIPARPFLKNSVDDNKEAIKKMCQVQIQSLKDGATAEDILKKLGSMQKALVQKKIADGDFTPNAPITIKGGWMRTPSGKAFYVKGKKSTRPLVGHNGQLSGSVNFVIKKKGGGDD